MSESFVDTTWMGVGGRGTGSDVTWKESRKNENLPRFSKILLEVMCFELQSAAMLNEASNQQLFQLIRLVKGWRIEVHKLGVQCMRCDRFLQHGSHAVFSRLFFLGLRTAIFCFLVGFSTLFTYKTQAHPAGTSNKIFWFLRCLRLI